MLSLIGCLAFAAKVVPLGHTFLRRLIDLSTTARNHPFLREHPGRHRMAIDSPSYESGTDER